MKFTELKKFLSEGGSGAFLLAGEDAYFLSNAEAIFKNAYLQMPELNFASFDGENLKGQNIHRLTESLSEFPFQVGECVAKVLK